VLFGVKNQKNWTTYFHEGYPYVTNILLLEPPYNEISRSFASGVRNAVGMDLDVNGNLWFVDQARKGLGDFIPPGELNFAPISGMNYGYPYCHGCCTVDPDINVGGICPNGSITPAINLDSHCSPLGISFYNGTMFPLDYVGDLFISEHGSSPNEKSWPPTGFKVERVMMDKTWHSPIGRETFIDFSAIQTEEDWNEKIVLQVGRIADTVFLSDGSMLLSDDGNAAIYRVTFYK